MISPPRAFDKSAPILFDHVRTLLADHDRRRHRRGKAGPSSMTTGTEPHRRRLDLAEEELRETRLALALPA
jgi:hypothetical protein